MRFRNRKRLNAMLKIKRCIQSILCGLALGCSGASQAVGTYKTFTDDISCGKAKLSIQSTCARGDDDMSLNVCKPQKMTMFSAGIVRSASLPELNQGDIKSITEEDGSVSELYVIKMGCAQVANANYAILYYSVGGGSAPYSEFWTAYDERGKLLDSKNFPLHGNALEKIYEKMKKVNSNMPE
jgi:hypothetical protein